MKNEYGFARLYTTRERVKKLYLEIDTLVTSVGSKTGIGCLPGCRKCCLTHSENIEVSILEFLPLAVSLWESGTAESCLELLEGREDDEPCVLLGRDELEFPLGGCTQYEFRPLTCRLFGFSAALNKNGRAVPMVCKYIREGNPPLIGEFAQLVESGLEVPIFSYCAERIEGVDPCLARKKYPINTALRKTLEFTGLIRDLSMNGQDRSA